jgi:hypothetical protein
MATFNVTGSGATATYDAPSDTITLNVPGGAGSPGTLAPVDDNLGTVTGTQTVNFGSTTYDRVIRLTLGGNVTLNLTNVPALSSVRILVIQGSGGPFTLTLQQDGSATTVKWDGGTAHTMSSASGAVDVIAVQKGGTNLYCATAGKGFA